jgi:hypothetical protein
MKELIQDRSLSEEVAELSDGNFARRILKDGSQRGIISLVHMCTNFQVGVCGEYAYSNIAIFY